MVYDEDGVPMFQVLARKRADTALMDRAHDQVAYAKRAGTLVSPEACAGCGRAVRLHAHHDDYRRPLDVRWLCPRCHASAHA